MTGKFDYFVLFAEMRTGSNFLEANLNILADVQCHGEAFNPNFIGYPKRTELMGMTRADREDSPEKLVAAIQSAPGRLNGFRYFHDHDARVFEPVIDDPRCAKIVLTRNPLDSYVSWKIAADTGQWKLTDVKRRKEAMTHFDPAEFARYMGAIQTFQARILNRLQTSGQTAFYLAYEDLRDIDVLNGLAKWLGAKDRLKKLDQSLKPQNPTAPIERVDNPAEMEQALEKFDRFNLSRTPNFEPRRGPAVPSYVAAANAPLLFMPIPGGPQPEIERWLAALDDVSADSLETGMNQKRLRQWMRAHPNHRCFTVLRHPLARAHSVFCSAILSDGPDAEPKMREGLERQFKLKLPRDLHAAPVDGHRHAFSVFLDFARANIAGQTALGPQAALCSQSSALSGFGEFALPDLALREEELPRMLPLLAELAGYRSSPELPVQEADAPFSLSEIYDEDLEKKAAQVYRRDYLLFGFGSWRALQAA
ncbi:nodulation protein NodH [Sedimentitalea todarodis]|uniref:Nodulation protein NodH n=1 Tax=Sedimentitalea todarodis TaxID=1631240 RepID=A0ABU3VK94_9RHOB|nr:nodulation protein NodH [Sedimentitalea todarodis]MDU9006603.1 nodulation protein NodH [Sedimentitalea todarodis]